MERNKLNINLLKTLVKEAESIQHGSVATYIPELANVNSDIIAIAVQPLGKEIISYTNHPVTPVTLQSTGKMIPLIGLLEEFGKEKLFEWVNAEPSGDDFASITRLEQFGPRSNPMLNAGAITLCSHIPGVGEQQFAWLESWVQKLFHKRLSLNPLVFASEKRTGDRNRSLAYLLKSKNLLGTDVNSALDLYFALCSYEATIEEMLYLPTLLANLGKDPTTGTQVISVETCKIALAIMATCGLYDGTGNHMVKTGMPAKSGVSGYIIAVVPGTAGVAVLSPRVNGMGNSIRGEFLLKGLSESMEWHFAFLDRKPKKVE